MSLRPAKSQISLGIRPVWSESSQCAQWVAEDPSFLHAHSEDSDQTGRMPRLIWVFAGRTLTLLVLSSRGLLTDPVFLLFHQTCHWNFHKHNSNLVRYNLVVLKSRYLVYWLRMKCRLPDKLLGKIHMLTVLWFLRRCSKSVDDGRTTKMDGSRSLPIL